ncbi:hypothetical protein LJ068_003804 [Escherichia coli]|uniref:hypothetical protein n=1 Tax=Escherichia coli TaxID=562 RepID=UPI00297A55BD|nr:hypothetical protein [Escherichia coli]EKN1675956.1 hypothetical protein [Escherichia coli]HAW3321007.1 hypothetical protein [Escherichia coli]
MKHNIWNPEFKLDAINIIKNLSIKGLCVGSSIIQLHEVMGETELPVTKLGKKSKIYYWLYGNISFLSEGDYVIAIDVDFHSNRMQVVTLDMTLDWSIDDWLGFGRENNYNIKTEYGLFYLTHVGITICLSHDGRLEMISLR